MPDLLNHLVSEFRGTPPDVPFAPGLAAEMFTDENDPRPFFVRLPLVEIGKKSANGLEWSVDASRNLVEQINSKRPEGILGHVPKEQRHFRYDLPSLRWVGATIVENKVWGKAFVPPDKQDVRDYLKQSMKLNARVGTSVYGTSASRGLGGFKLESIDLGHPDRVANPTSVAVPHVTAENEDNGGLSMDAELLINELKDSRDKAQGELKTLDKAHDALQAKFDALTASRQEASTVVSELRSLDGFADDTDLVAEVRGLQAQVTTLVAEKREADVAVWVSEFVTMEELRPTVASNIGTPETKDEAKTLIADLMKRDDIKGIAAALVAQKGGPRVTVSESGGEIAFDDSPEAIAASNARTGFGG